MSERTLLAVALAARKSEFSEGLPAAIDMVLSSLGVALILRDRERIAMNEHRVERTRRRSVLGVMTDLSFAIEIGPQDGMSSCELSMCLAETPLKSIGYESPEMIVRELFGAPGK